MRLAASSDKAVCLWRDNHELRPPKIAERVVIDATGLVHLVEGKAGGGLRIRDGGLIRGYADGPEACTEFHALRERRGDTATWDIDPESATAREPVRVHQPPREIEAAHQRAWHEHVWTWYADALRARRIRCDDRAAVYTDEPTRTGR